MALMRESDAESDRERVEALIGAWRGNALAVVGVDAVRRALEMGQVDELVITASPEVPAGNELIVKARQTAAKIRFIEDASLLAGIGGAGALLRFKLDS